MHNVLCPWYITWERVWARAAVRVAVAFANVGVEQRVLVERRSDGDGSRKRLFLPC